MCFCEVPKFKDYKRHFAQTISISQPVHRYDELKMGFVLKYVLSEMVELCQKGIVHWGFSFHV